MDNLIDTQFLTDLGFTPGTNFPREMGREVWTWRGNYWLVFGKGPAWTNDACHAAAEDFASRKAFAEHFLDSITEEANESGYIQGRGSDHE